MKRWAGIAAAVMLGMSLSLTGCGKAVNKGPSAPLVKTIVIGEDAKDAKDTFSGTVHGFFESPLAFQTGGRGMIQQERQNNIINILGGHSYAM